MNDPSSEREDLLRDILSEAVPTGFREAALGRTLRLAQRRRWRGRLRTVAVSLAVPCVVMAVAWFLSSRPSTSGANRPTFALVHTSALQSEQIVRTAPTVDRSTAFAFEPVTMVRTSKALPSVRLLDDDALLAMIAPRPAALVWRTPDTADLLFLNASDADGFRVN